METNKRDFVHYSFLFFVLLLKQTLISPFPTAPSFLPHVPLSDLKPTCQFFNQSAQLPRVSSIYLSVPALFYRASIIPSFQMSLSILPVPFSVIRRVNSRSSALLFSSAPPESESQHRNAVITQAENCNSREICLLFGLVVLNPNELSDSAGKELSLIPVRVICTTRK